MSIKVSTPLSPSDPAGGSGYCARGGMLGLTCGLVGTYLGIEVAIKEVLPSNDYDVAKYFEREWRLMK